jgi:putative transcriptional regulator
MKNWVRVLRLERGWNQSELAERLGVSRQSVNAVENGRYIPSLPLALKIGQVFETPIEAIFEAEG